MTPTPEQIAAIEAFRTGSLRVNAYAGAAKTTTATLIARDQDQKWPHLLRQEVGIAKVESPTG